MRRTGRAVVVLMLFTFAVCAKAPAQGGIRGQNFPSPNQPPPPPKAWRQAPLRDADEKNASILFWSPSRPFVDAWVSTVPTTDANRLERLRTLFVKDECTPVLESTGKKSDSNLICTLPGETDDTVVIAAHYNHPGKGTGAIENWSGAAMLPLLYHALQATKRQTTFVFAAFDGERGAHAFLKAHRKLKGGEIRAVLALDSLGMSPTRTCSFPDNSMRFLQDLQLEQVLLSVANTLGASGMPQRENCFEVLKADDTEGFRKASIPSLVIHSISREKHSLPGSEQDTAAAIDTVSYYNTFQLLATYLCLIDRHLQDVLKPGRYDPMRASLSIPHGKGGPPPSLPANLNDVSEAADPLPPPPQARSSAAGDDVPHRVVLDVVATGKDGAPVSGLRQDQFEVLEDGKPQQITSFEEHKPNNAIGLQIRSPAEGAQPAAEAPASATPSSPLTPITPQIAASIVPPALPLTSSGSTQGRSPTDGGAAPGDTPKRAAAHPGSLTYYTNQLPPVDSAVVVVLDGLNTPGSDWRYERRSMIAYLKTLSPESHLAVFGLGSQLWMFQGLAGNTPSLLAAVDSVLEKRRLAATAPYKAEAKQILQDPHQTDPRQPDQPQTPSAAPPSTQSVSQPPNQTANATRPDIRTQSATNQVGNNQTGSSQGDVQAPAPRIFYANALEQSLADFDADIPMTACPPHKHLPRAPILFVSPNELPPDVDPTLCLYSPGSRALLTLDSFQQIARYLQALPGRKSIVWFSQAYPLPLTPEMLTETAQSIGSISGDKALDYSSSMLRLAADLTAAQVSLYPVDARGVEWPRVDMVREFETRSMDGYLYLWGRPEQQRRDSKMLAEITGGHAFTESKDFAAAVARATLDDSRYYTFAYTPAATGEEFTFRKTVVRLRDASVSPTSRHGYYPPIVPEKSAPSTATPGQEPGPTLDQSFANAMRPGLPPATGIIFNARGMRQAVQANPEAIRYTLDFNVRYSPTGSGESTVLASAAAPNAASPTPPAISGESSESIGTAATQRLIFAAAATDASGNQLQSLWKPLKLEATPEARAKETADGVPFQMEIEVPPKATTVTLGVYDPTSGRMGSLDIPLTRQDLEH